jgi:hypothetical protein
VNETPLKRWWNVKFRLLKREPKAFTRLRPLASELEQQKEVLERDETASMSSRWQAEQCAWPRIVRDDGLQKAVAVSRCDAQLQQRSGSEKARQFSI